MTRRVVFDLTLTLRSPFLMRALHGARFGAGAAQLRDEDGTPIMPADQVRGIFRHALHELCAATGGRAIGEALLRRLFGAKSRGQDETGEHDRPERALLIFSDLRAPSLAGTASGETTRIAIDDETGAARTGHILVSELVAPMGAEVAFAGTIVGLLADDEVETVAAALRKAMPLITAVGTAKSAGFGEVLAERSRIAVAADRPLALPSGGAAAQARLAFRLTFDRPILVDAWQADRNMSVGAAIVPGAALKGALARKLMLAGEDPENGRCSAALAALVVSHAFPESADGRISGLPLPLSLVAGRGGDGIVIGDALGLPPGRGAMIAGRAAIFQPDWKPAWFAAAREALGHPPFDEPANIARAHVEIGDERVAVDGALFTLVARSARLGGGPRGWRMTLDFAGIDDAAMRAVLLGLFRDGLDAIGRTGASAAVADLPGVEMPAIEPVPGGGNRFAVVLRTPAAMTDAAPGTSARAAYEDYWRQTLPAARLIDFFAAQRLAGGYLAMRRRAYGPQRYQPFVLTEPGSVFLLEGDVAGNLAHFARTGLPVPPLGGRQVDWRSCPFVPENGFGAIDVGYRRPGAEVEHV